MEKGDIRKHIYDILKATNKFKKVYKSKVLNPTDTPVIGIHFPLTEPFYEESTNNRVKPWANLDVLLNIVVATGEDDIKDFQLDDLVKVVKTEIKNKLTDIKGIVGFEWQHDEEYSATDKSEQGVTIYYKVQYEVADIIAGI